MHVQGYLRCIHGYGYFSVVFGCGYFLNVSKYSQIQTLMNLMKMYPDTGLDTAEIKVPGYVPVDASSQGCNVKFGIKVTGKNNSHYQIPWP